MPRHIRPVPRSACFQYLLNDVQCYVYGLWNAGVLLCSWRLWFTVIELQQNEHTQTHVFSASAVLRYSDQHVAIALSVSIWWKPLTYMATKNTNYIYLQIYCKMCQRSLCADHSAEQTSFICNRVNAVDSSAFLSRASHRCSDSSIYSIS